MLHKTLENGIEVAIRESHFAKMVAIQCWVQAGSLHEVEGQFGMAHVLEHMLFKGTSKRGVGEISRLIESYGGDINAYTTFDHTVYYLTLASEYFSEGVDILADAVFNSTFDEAELAKEKEVILEEISQGNDNPGNLVGRKVFEEIYRNHPAARPIIGSEETVAKFSRDDLMEFHSTWYRPDNMRVVVAGDVETVDAMELIKEKFGKVTGTTVGFDIPKIIDKPAGISVRVIEGDYNQPRIELAFPGPCQEHPDQVDLDLAAFALGAGDSARLTMSMRDELNLASSVGCSLYSPSFGGIFGASAIPEPDKIRECVYELGKQLSNLRFLKPVSDSELKRAVTNLRADSMYQEETVNGQARSLGYSLSTQHKCQYDAVYEAKVKHTTPSSIANALDRWLLKEHAVIVALIPKGFEVDRESLRIEFEQGFSQAEKGQIVGMVDALRGYSGEKKENFPEIVEIREGLKLVYRRNSGPALFNMVAVTEGGLRGDGNQPGLQNCFANLITCATQNLDYQQIVSEVESHGAVLAGFSGKDSLGVKLQCFSEHLDSMAKIWFDSLVKPVFPSRQWEITKLEIQDDIRGELDSPAGTATRRFQELVFAKHPYRYPLYGDYEGIKDLTAETLLTSFENYRDGGPWVIGVVGNLPKEKVENSLREWFEDWSPHNKGKRFESRKLQNLVSSQETIDFDKEQTHVVYGGQGLTWADGDRHALDVLSTILGGSGGRFFINLRDKQGLAYTVTPMLTYGCDPGAFGAYLACAPNKVGQAMAALKQEFSDLRTKLVPLGEIDRAKNYLIGSHESEMQRGDGQAMTMALMEVYGLGFGDFLNYSDKVKKVTAEQVREVARRVLNPETLVSVRVGRS